MIYVVHESNHVINFSETRPTSGTEGGLLFVCNTIRDRSRRKVYCKLRTDLRGVVDMMCNGLELEKHGVTSAHENATDAIYYRALDFV